MDKAGWRAYDSRMQDFFDAYGQAYVDKDFAAIASFFAFPCMLTNQAGTDLVCDADALAQHVEGFVADSHAQGLTRAVPVLVEDRVYGAANRTVLVSWRLFGGQSAPFAEFAFLYVLAGGDGAWKIQLANLI